MTQTDTTTDPVECVRCGTVLGTFKVRVEKTPRNYEDMWLCKRCLAQLQDAIQE